MHSDATPGRRSYDSALRRQQAADTRRRILEAGSELLHVSPVWNWPALTVRTVASKAGVNERTVYRYFGSERELRDAVMTQILQESGVDLGHLRLDDIDEVSRRVFAYLASFPPPPQEAQQPREQLPDPTIADVRRRKRGALLAAVTPTTPAWSAEDREVAAAALDLLWSVTSYRHLIYEWELEPSAAVRCVSWLLRLVTDAVRSGETPPR